MEKKPKKKPLVSKKTISYQNEDRIESNAGGEYSVKRNVDRKKDGSLVVKYDKRPTGSDTSEGLDRIGTALSNKADEILAKEKAKVVLVAAISDEGLTHIIRGGGVTTMTIIEMLHAIVEGAEDSLGVSRGTVASFTLAKQISEKLSSGADTIGYAYSGPDGKGH